MPLFWCSFVCPWNRCHVLRLVWLDPHISTQWATLCRTIRRISSSISATAWVFRLGVACGSVGCCRLHCLEFWWWRVCLAVWTGVSWREPCYSAYSVTRMKKRPIWRLLRSSGWAWDRACFQTRWWSCWIKAPRLRNLQCFEFWREVLLLALQKIRRSHDRLEIIISYRINSLELESAFILIVGIIIKISL